jgi:hypothetical protein
MTVRAASRNQLLKEIPWRDAASWYAVFSRSLSRSCTRSPSNFFAAVDDLRFAMLQLYVNISTALTKCVMLITAFEISRRAFLIAVKFRATKMKVA